MGNPPAKPENNAGRGWGALGEGNSSRYESCRAGGLERAHVGLAQSPLIQSLPPTGSKPSCSQGDNQDMVLPTAPMPAAWISLREI